MEEHSWLTEQFEENRGHLRAVAYRMLGSLSEADDAVQETWLRLSRSDASQIGNLGGWLTTVVSRVCLDMLRSRTSRKEDALEVEPGIPDTQAGTDPEQETVMADRVGLALMVVLDRLAPAERLAFILHDVFAVSFDEIASILGRSADAARQLATRARRRIQGAPTISRPDLTQQREVANAFLTALRAGDFEGLMAVLDPDVVVRVDAAAARPGPPREIRGAQNWAKGAIAFSRHVSIRGVQPMLVDGEVGLVWAPRGRLSRVLRLSMKAGKIATVNVIADPAALEQLELAVLND